MKCLRCGTDQRKRLVQLHEFLYTRWVPVEFYVCSNRKKCKTRQQALRPARMKVNESDIPMPGHMMELEWA